MKDGLSARFPGACLAADEDVGTQLPRRVKAMTVMYTVRCDHVRASEQTLKFCCVVRDDLPEVINL